MVDRVVVDMDENLKVDVSQVQLMESDLVKAVAAILGQKALPGSPAGQKVLLDLTAPMRVIPETEEFKYQSELLDVEPN